LASVAVVETVFAVAGEDCGGQEGDVAECYGSKFPFFSGREGEFAGFCLGLV
jgi:hypothetical protein